MKLSFSTRGWAGMSWNEQLETAAEMRFGGVELYDVYKQPAFFEKGGPLHKHMIASTVRSLKEKKISIPCLDTSCDLAGGETELERIREMLVLAADLHVPCVGAFASHGSGEDAEAALRALLPAAEQTGVCLLIKTSGIFADTALLRDVLDRFACDQLGVVWDMHHPYRDHGESAAQTIANLGAYVRHVHLRDSDDSGAYALVGEGTMPIAEMMDALISIDYNGYISLEWKPDWLEELTEAEVIFPYFVNYMNRFGSKGERRSDLYFNARHTGQYVWKKDALIKETFSGVLDRMVEEFPDQLAVKYTTLNYTRTYSEFRDDVDDFARSLIALGVKPGQHVAMWATNLPQWYIGFWATTKIGAVLVTMNSAYKIHEAEYLLRHSDTHTLVMIDGYRDSDYVAAVRELCPELEHSVPGRPLHCQRLPFLRNVITVDSRQSGCLTWDEAMGYAARVPVEEVYRRAAAVDIHDVCNMQYTSGTTGFPKGVMLTHYNVVNNGKYIGDHMDLSTADRMMIQVPMFHCFGMVLSMTASMTHGTTMCPLPYFSPKPALACVNQEHITTFNGVPTMFIAMMQHPDFAKTDFSYMRTGIMAGSNCPAELMRQATEVMNMKQIISVYGQTEASPGCTMSSFDDPLDVRTDTVGSAFANVECKVVDPETGKDCPDDVIGEFVARGYNIMKGYYKMPAATAAAIDPDGWLHSGDLVARDKNGNYRVTGRLKDMIIRGGENNYPKEIEEFFYTHPKIQDVQVIGVPDEQYGEEIMACIVLKAGEESTAEEMKQFVRSHMARHKVPRYIDFVRGFPMNDAGKILKYKMREDAAERIKCGELK